MLLNFSEFKSPDDNVGTSVENEPKGQGKEDVIDFLGEDDKDDDEKPLELDKDKDKKIVDEDDEDEESDEESDELEDIEDELEGPSEEQLELMTPVRRGEILAKYPKLFKEFPYLERAYYREQQFTEIFPTISDAKAANEKLEIFNNLEKQLLDGNTEDILKAVKEESPKAFHKIADEYLTTLAKVDQQAYHVVIGNIVKHTIFQMVKESRSSNNEVLQQAAQVLNQFVFGSSDYTPPSRLSNDKDTKDNGKDNEIKQREQSLTRQQFETTKETLNNKVNNVLRATIDGNIDPKDSMSDYVKRTASREAMEELQSLIGRDTRFRTILDRLWENAFEKRFDKTSTDRIRAAYLSKAKTLLPAVIKKARNEALKGLGKRVNDNDEDDQPSKKGPISPGRPRTERSGRITKAEDIPRGMKTIDFLNSD